MEAQKFDPIGRGLDLGTLFGLLAGAAATAIQPDVWYFAMPTLLGMGLGLLWGWLTKRRYA